MKKQDKMNEQTTSEKNTYDSNLTKGYKITKIVQMIIVFLFELGFYIFLRSDDTLRKHIYDNRAIFILCSLIWIFMMIVFLFLLYDFIVVKKMIQEKHYLNQIAYLDGLTGIPNRHSIDVLFKTYNTPASLENVCCAVYKIANIKEINTTMTHEDGDKVIRDFCDLFEALGDEYGFVGRNSGNEFIIVINDCSEPLFGAFHLRLEQKIAHYNKEMKIVPLVITYSHVLNSELKASSFSDLLASAYQGLNKEKPLNE